MPALTNQPLNPNPLHKTKFKFVMQRAPNVVFWSQKTLVPGVSLAVANQITPFTNIPRPGGKMQFDTYTLTFKVDEDMTNYLEIFNWMVDLGFVSDMNGYTRQEKQGHKEVSDATLMLLTSKENGNMAVTFKDMFPVAMSALDFDTTGQDIAFLDATVTFEYTSFSISRINNHS